MISSLFNEIADISVLRKNCFPSLSEFGSRTTLESRLGFLLLEHIATGFPVPVRKRDEGVSELSLFE